MNGQHCFIAMESGLLSGVWEHDRLAVFGTEAAPPLNYLAADRNAHRIYATGRYEICAFDWKADRLSFSFQAPCMGNVACHLCLSPEDHRHLFCANYISGNIAVFRISENGFEFVQSITGEGVLGNNEKRQEGPHAHYCTFIDGDLWTADLGQDAIFIFPWDGERLGRETARIQFPSGSGPRHFVYDPVRAMIYCASELSCELFVIDRETLRIIAAKRVAGGEGDALSAIRLSPDGTTIGIGIRGSDQVAFLSTEDFHLRTVIHSGEKCIRDFDFADQETICTCGQDSSAVSFFNWNGKRHDVPISRIAVKKPMCVMFAQ